MQKVLLLNKKLIMLFAFGFVALFVFGTLQLYRNSRSTDSLEQAIERVDDQFSSLGLETYININGETDVLNDYDDWCRVLIMDNKTFVNTGGIYSSDNSPCGPFQDNTKEQDYRMFDNAFNEISDILEENSSIYSIRFLSRKERNFPQTDWQCKSYGDWYYCYS